MNFVIGQRNSGRTSALIDWTNQAPDRLLVVPTQQEFHRIRKNLKNPGQVCLMADAGHVYYTNAVSEVAIDNLDLLLSSLLRVPANEIKLVSCEGMYVGRDTTTSFRSTPASSSMMPF